MFSRKKAGHKGYSGLPVLHSGSLYHGGLLQLMIHTIDPMSDGMNFRDAKLIVVAQP